MRAQNRPTAFVSTEAKSSLLPESTKSYRSSTALFARVVSVVLVVVSTLLSPLSIAAEPGRIEGVVTDPDGANVVGATVSLHTGASSQQTRTDDQGRFVLSRVPEGRYHVVVEAAGFAQRDELAIELKSGEHKNVDVQLQVAAVGDQMLVSATRTETAQSELGESASLISNTTIERQHQSLITESLRKIPGVAVLQSGGRGGLTSVFVRGGESDYNKVLIDGVPVNDAGGAFDFAPLNTENIERVEVARGPNSAVFGSDAMTSVIQLITKRGSTSEPAFEFLGEGGSFDFHRETARLSGLKGIFDYSTSIGYESIDGRFRNSDYINRSASGNFGLRPTSGFDLRFTARANNATLGVPGPTAQLFADPDQRQKHHDIATGATLDLNLSTIWKQSARFIFAENDTLSFDPGAQDLRSPDTLPLPPGTFGDDFVFLFNNHQKRIGFQYQSIAVLNRSNLLTAGLDFDHESAVFDDGFTRVGPSRNNLGFYLQDQIAFRNRLFVTGGVRVERNTATVPEDLRSLLVSLGSIAPSGEVGFGLSANPKLAASLVVRPHREQGMFGGTRLKASFGTGIKEPRLDEAFGSSFFAIGNPRLDPERAHSFEIGIVQDFFGRRGTLELTYFDGRFRDQIEFIFDPLTFGAVTLPDGTLTNFVNVDRATARGIELQASAQPTRRLMVSGNYTFLSSHLDEAFDPINKEVGLPLLRRPRHSGAISATLLGSRWDVSLDGSFVGERRDIDPVFGARFDLIGNPIFNDGYAKLNGAGTFHLSRFVSLFARVENLLNEDYQEVLGFPAYRLNFSAGLRLRIGGKR